MILADKIMNLRKQLGWSQEELAEKLGVSRQSVSKWELGSSIPDIDKLLKMSELFGVSTDYLLKEYMNDAEYIQSEDKDAETVISAEIAAEYTGAVKKSVKGIANAVSMFICCPVLLIFLAGCSEINLMTENVASAIGLFALFLLIAAGVAICVLEGHRLSKFDYLDKGSFSLQYGVEGILNKKKSEYEATLRMGNMIGVSLIILAVVPLILEALLIDNDFYTIICTCFLLIMISAGVNILVRVNTINESFTKLLKVDDFDPEKKSVSKIMAAFSSFYWLMLVAFFLYRNMTRGYYYNASYNEDGVIFVVGAVVFAGLYALIRPIATHFVTRK